MSKLSKIRMILIIGMSLSIVFAFSNLVYAVDDDPFIDYVGNNSNAELQTSSNTNSVDDDFKTIEAGNTNANSNNNSNVDNTNIASDLLTNNTNNQNSNVNNGLKTNSNTNSNVNRNVSNTETLAKTGLTDSNGFVVFIVVLCGISAIYSIKKIRDYKKI